MFRFLRSRRAGNRSADATDLTVVFTPEVLDLLIATWVFDAPVVPRPDDYFDYRLGLWNTALVLKTFVEEEFSDRRFIGVREAFEHKIFGERETPAAVKFVADVKSTIADQVALDRAIGVPDSDQRRAAIFQWAQLWCQKTRIVGELDQDAVGSFVLNYAKTAKVLRDVIQDITRMTAREGVLRLTAAREAVNQSRGNP